MSVSPNSNIRNNVSDERVGKWNEKRVTSDKNVVVFATPKFKVN